MRASAGCSWALCSHFEQRLDQTDILAVLEQVGREGMTQRMKETALRSPAAFVASLNSRPNWRVVR